LKRSIDACSNPPYFRGVSTPITDLLDAAEPKVSKQKRDQTKDKAGQKQQGKIKLRPTRQAQMTPTNPILLVDQNTNNPPNYLTVLNDPTLTLPWMARKLRLNPKGSFMMTSSAATARVAIKAGISVPIARNLMPNGKINSTRRKRNT
jgi:hypothetical protein